MFNFDARTHTRDGVRTVDAKDGLQVLRLALQSIPHAVAIADERGTIVFVNDLANAIFGYAHGELIGQPFFQLLVDHGYDHWAAFTQLADMAAGTGAHAVTGIRNDGARLPLDISLQRWTSHTTRYVIVSVVDLTDRLNLEARLAAATNSHLGFQRLIGDIATRFSGIDLKEVDDAIVSSLRQIGEALQLECVTLWRKPAREMLAVPTHQWIQPACPASADNGAMVSIAQMMATLEQGTSCCFATLDDLPEPTDREAFSQLGIRSGALVPLGFTEKQSESNALMLGSTTRTLSWTPAIIERLRLAAAVMSQAYARSVNQKELEAALAEIHELRDRVTSERVELRRQVKVLSTNRRIVSESAAVRQVLMQVDQVASTPATVLLLGETGCGKEVMAQAIHDLSPRRHRPMIHVSCAAMPTALIESELFGREKGAYTGALSRQIGRFEAANQSTLFLDEIGELPMEVQVKLLRVLQERVIERLGSHQTIKVDVRIIAATNRNLDDAVRNKTFREDLFYRLNVFPISVPPLRERLEDIPALVWNFIDEFAGTFGKTIDSLSKESLSDLRSYPWPGNVRELRNVIERAVIVATGHHLVVPTPRLGERAVPLGAMTLSALEVEHIRGVLESTGWRVRGPGGAAERLGLKPTTLESRMARLGITRKRAS